MSDNTIFKLKFLRSIYNLILKLWNRCDWVFEFFLTNMAVNFKYNLLWYVI